MTKHETQPESDGSNGKENGKENDKEDGNGKPLPSHISITFPAPGLGDPTRVDRYNATHAQAIVAGFYLIVGAFWELLNSLNAQEAQRRQEQAQMDAILHATKVPQKD